MVWTVGDGEAEQSRTNGSVAPGYQLHPLVTFIAGKNMSDNYSAMFRNVSEHFLPPSSESYSDL